MTPSRHTPPEHLTESTRAWWAEIVRTYRMQAHHLRLLTLAGEAWDRCQQARELLAEHGLTYMGRHDTPRPRPEVAIERDNRLAFARLLRELGLDIEGPGESRPPRVRGR